MRLVLVIQRLRFVSVMWHARRTATRSFCQTDHQDDKGELHIDSCLSASLFVPVSFGRVFYVRSHHRIVMLT